jgi:hypothetical protein
VGGLKHLPIWGVEDRLNVAKGPKFRPQSTKGAEKKIWWENHGPNICQIYKKGPKRGKHL